MANIISLCNHKGGCGKTTSAVSIAWGLCLSGKNVLLIDLDPQANTTQAVGVNPYTIEKTIYGALLGKYALPRVTLGDFPPSKNGVLQLVPACLDLMAAEMQLVNEYNREHLLAELLKPIEEKFDYVVIDCPPSLAMLTTNALTASNLLLLPVQPHFFAVQGLQQLLEVVARVQRRLNPSLKVGGVFLTDFNGRVKMHTDAAAAIEQAFPVEMFKTRIRHNVALSESSAIGKSIYEYEPKSNGAKDYGQLTEEIIARFG